MIAYLPNGRIMDYEDYIHSPEWKALKKKRYDYDSGKCCICHKVAVFPAHHHITYERLGHEDVVTDIITICNSCHNAFHRTWGKITGITSQMTPAHWKYYSHQTTLDFFVDYEHEDILLGGKLKMTSNPVIRECIEEYYKVHDTDPTRAGLISEDDVKIFFRNRRLELLIYNLIYQGKTYEEFLTEQYGEKGNRIDGPNELRNEANKFFKDMADSNCIKAKRTLYDSQYRYIENLWDQYKIKALKEDKNNAETE